MRLGSDGRSHFVEVPVFVLFEATIDKGVDVRLVEGKVVEIANEQDAAYNINQ